MPIFCDIHMCHSLCLAISLAVLCGSFIKEDYIKEHICAFVCVCVWVYMCGCV